MLELRVNVLSVRLPVDVIVNNDEVKLRLSDILKLDRVSAPVLIVNTKEELETDTILLDVPTPLILTLSVSIDISLVSFECVPDIKLTYSPVVLSKRSLPTPDASVPQGESEYPHSVDVSLPFDDT